MPTFIDESGGTGHSRDSKPYFRLAAVWLPTPVEADRFRHAVRQIRPELGVGLDYEFKFAATHRRPELRQAFFETALQGEFRFTVCAIDKSAGYWRNAPSGEQHWATATSLAVCLHPVYHQAEKPQRPLREPVLVDRNDDRNFLAAIRTAFRGLRSRLHPGLPLVQTPCFRKSHPDEVMQLVDMVCGAAGAYIDGDARWYNLLNGGCLGLIELP